MPGGAVVGVEGALQRWYSIVGVDGVLLAGALGADGVDAAADVVGAAS